METLISAYALWILGVIVVVSAVWVIYQIARLAFYQDRDNGLRFEADIHRQRRYTGNGRQ